MIKTDEFRAAKKIIKTLNDNKFTGVICGGAVRDILLGIKPKDWDIATSATPDEVESIFEKTIPVGKEFGVIIVLENNFQFEVCTFREDSKESDGRRPNGITFSTMETDALRRDFTINGIFFDPITETIFDFVNGKKDIESGKIRFIGNSQERINEDKLRMLRAVRFTTRFGFDMDNRTKDLIKNNAHKITSISVERIKAEIDKMLQSENPSKSIELLEELNLLEHFLPEVSILWKTAQSAHWHTEGATVKRKIFTDKNNKIFKLGPSEDFDGTNPNHSNSDKFKFKHGNVGIHTMMVLDNTRKQTSDLPTLWAALLHDIGKPETAGINSHGDINNHGHDKLGAEMSEVIMNRLKTSTKEKEVVVAIVRDHMKAHLANKMNKSTLRRFVSQNHIEQLIFVTKADCKSAIPSPEAMNKRKDDSSKFLLNFIENMEEVRELPPCLLSGKDLIDLNKKPGPEFKIILTDVMNRQLEGELETVEEALNFVKTNY